MRKMTGIFGAAVIVMGLTLAACGSSDGGSASTGSGSSGSSASSAEGFSFTSGSTKIEMNADASGIIEELGDPEDYFESESCAFEGLDKVYTYPRFHLEKFSV